MTITQPPFEIPDLGSAAVKTATPTGTAKTGYEPPNLGKAIRLPVPDFSDPHRPKVCLEVDFPIVPINALSNLEGNAGKPIYQMSKWWARRRSSVFRSLLIAAAVQAPDDPSQAAKRVWEYYYANHQKARSFRKLRVLDPFMGGGTTLVEGARLGMQMTGVDLNPVAWFVTKNELAGSDPAQVRAFFDHIEAEVKPLIQPFYVTTCPRGHAGRWVDATTGATAQVDPLDLASVERKRYRWEGPEVIYTFWAKHGPCQATGCGHRTPIFKTPVIAEKHLSTRYIETICPSCGRTFNVELGETRMAPGVERVVIENEPAFTETSQEFARLVMHYGQGNTADKREQVFRLLALVDHEPALHCPRCEAFAGRRLKSILDRHAQTQRASDIKKADLGITSCHVYMYLLVNPAWLRGAAGSENDTELGGWAGADPERTATWYRRRLEGLSFVEVRGRVKLAEAETTQDTDDAEIAEEESVADADSEAERKKYGPPPEIVLSDGTHIQTGAGTVPKKSHFTCGSCGRRHDILEAVKPTGHTAPVSAYALQCYCPQCDAEGYNYSGRFFKAPDVFDLERLKKAESEWATRCEAELADYWPREELFTSYMTHRLNGGIPNWGYTHWWKMFSPRQLLVHAQILRAIVLAPDSKWPLDVSEQALGAFQQHLRYCSMFSFYQQQYDKTIPHFSNANYHPKMLVSEISAFAPLGAGRWISCADLVVEGVSWESKPWELAIDTTGKSWRVETEQESPLPSELFCGSSADLSMLSPQLFDLVMTDPPFGDNLFYADLADFFYVWLRIPLLKLYEGLREKTYFVQPRSPHAVEAIRNPVEHPDDRKSWEQETRIELAQLATIRQLAGDPALQADDLNPLYRPEPASDFYRQMLTACWTEAARLLKPGGLMAFTFHHSADAPWMDVLGALFDAGYTLVATYPIRSDETKGAGGAFGSRKIEYDIVHVCRKRLEAAQPVSWARMRRWVKEEVQTLKTLLERTHGKELPESDLRVILRGKALEFYSQHYGQVYTGDGQTMNVRDALLGINQLLDDLVQGSGETARQRPPEAAEPTTRLFLSIFSGRPSLGRDELHKMLRGTGVAQDDLTARGWIRVAGTTAYVTPIPDRLSYFVAPGRNRKVIKTDLDQAHFLIGAALPKSGINVTDELDRGTFRLKRSVDAILEWYARTDPTAQTRAAATLALNLVTHWRARPRPAAETAQLSLFDQLEAEEA